MMRLHRDHHILSSVNSAQLHSPQARRVAQRDTLVTVRHVVPVEAEEQPVKGAPERPPEQRPAKLLLFLVHSRLPRVAAITAVQP